MEISDSLQEIIIGYYEGSLTQVQAEELLSWIGISNENLRYFRQMGEIWHATDPLSETDTDDKRVWQNIEERIASRDIRKIPSREIRLPVNTLYKIAASLVFLVALGITGYLMVNKKQAFLPSDLYVETSAPKGSRSLITLPDSTTVWLNAGTTFRYSVNYGISDRIVSLTGEAYFKVHKNSRMPFIVNASGILVTALGTAFNVKAYEEENTIETTLEEGSVRIDLANELGIAKPFDPIVLKPKQNAVFQKLSGNIQLNESSVQDRPAKIQMLKEMEIRPVSVSNVPDTRIYTSWKDSRWIFKNEKLGSLVPKLERRYDVSITFMSSDLKEYAFSGTLLEESLEQVLTALQLAAPVRFEIEGKEVRLYANKGALEYYNQHKK